MTIVLKNMASLTAITAEIGKRCLELAKNMLRQLLPQRMSEKEASMNTAVQKCSPAPVQAYSAIAAEEEICIAINIAPETAVWEEIDSLGNTRRPASKTCGKEYRRAQQTEKRLLNSVLPGTVLSGWGTEELSSSRKKGRNEIHRWIRKENRIKKDRTRQQRQWERERHRRHRNNQEIISGFDLRKICFPECA